MENIVIDSDILIDFLRNKKYAIDLIKKYENKNLATTAINVFELYFGAYKSGSEKRVAKLKGLFNSLTILNTTKDNMEIAGKIAAKLQKSGKEVGMRDLLIAAIAMVNNFSVMTNNIKHFKNLDVKIVKD